MFQGKQLEKLDFDEIRMDRQVENNRQMLNVLNAQNGNDMKGIKNCTNDNKCKRTRTILNKMANPFGIEIPDNFNVSDLDHNQCKILINILISSIVSKTSSRQGAMDEKMQFDACNEVAKYYGIEIENLSSTAVILTDDGKLITNVQKNEKNIQKSDCQKSLDGKILGNFTGYITAKVVLGCGGHQDNVYKELDSYIKIWTTYNLQENLILLIDHNDESRSRFDELYERTMEYPNIYVFDTYTFRLFIMENFKDKYNESYNKENNVNTANNSKKLLGQFYTTNYEYILSNLYIPEDVDTIIEPFAGNGDLLKFIKNKNDKTLELYDIDPKCDNTIKRDTLLDPPCYKNKFVLTNPPYLARNKNKDKTLYDKYKCNDLYKCFITNLIESDCSGGIIIVPLNFISSVMKNDIKLRARFISKYNISIINVFEERVFNDTTCTVCSIQFSPVIDKTIETNIHLFPSDQHMKIAFNKDNNYTIGNEIFNIKTTKDIKIERAKTNSNKEMHRTNILLKCIDDNITNQICLSIVNDEVINNHLDTSQRSSARSYAAIISNKKLAMDEQRYLVNQFNTFITEKRALYKSLFLPQFRESNSIARKRIPFNLAFKICNNILSTMKLK
jgi:hypothetical protein